MGSGGKKVDSGDFPGGPVAKTGPSAGGPDLFTGQVTRSHMPQLRPSAAKLVNN